MIDLDPKYTEKCNLQTICSEDKGFFAEFLHCVKEACGDKWITENFHHLEGNQAKLKSVFDDFEVCGPVLGTLEHVSPIFKEKNQRISIQKRFEGDQAAKSGDLKKALILYSQSVIRAPEVTDPQIDDGLTLAKALWSRSAVLVGLGNGEKALQDLKFSLEMGLSAKDNPDYYWRMGQCYTLTKEKKRAQVAFGVTEKMLAGRPSLLQKLKIDQDKAEELVEDSSPTSNKKAIKLAGGEDGELKGASAKIGIKSAPEKGRYLAAKSDIRPGDDLIFEEPVASCLLPAFSGSHCHHCLTKLEAPIGCSTCSGIAFCSPECKKAAQYHKFECQYMDLIVGSGMSILSQLVLRLVTQNLTPTKAIEANGIFLKNLVTHSENRSSEDFLNRTLMVALLIRILQKSEFFGRRMTEAVDPTEIELKVADQMLDLLQALQFNAHEIYEVKVGENHRITGSKMTYIGVGIYKTASLLNHDCFPSLARYFQGNKLVLTALRSIDQGEAVTENYGPLFTKHTLKERQRMLRSRYWFQCDCRSCKENWPVLAQLINKPRLKCPNFNCDNVIRFPEQIQKKLKCVKCKDMISLLESALKLKEAEELYKNAAKEMENQNLDAAIPLFEEGLLKFHEVAVPPHKDTHLALESLRVCYSDRGNVVKF